MVGIRGIGKTTLNKSMLSRLPWIDYLIGSSILRQLVGDDFINFDRYPNERKQYFREQAIRYMEQRQVQTQKDILVDGHTTLYNQGTGQVEGVFTDLDCRFYTDLIYYHAPAEIVQKRRQNDQTKKRIVDLEIIKQELQGEREESMRIAKDYRMGWYEISEDTENLQQNLYSLLLQLHEESMKTEAKK
jgi:adenylate kinase